MQILIPVLYQYYIKGDGQKTLHLRASYHKKVKAKFASVYESNAAISLANAVLYQLMGQRPTPNNPTTQQPIIGCSASRTL